MLRALVEDVLELACLGVFLAGLALLAGQGLAASLG